MKSQVKGRVGERGSALLIVFVMAAALAILLYTELPVAAFEAQRQREQQLIDRGNEYAHAVKLFVRKVGNYPPSLDALEDTNRMRFLRHRFKDPFTGKDDWRLLHAGPGGTLIDSKVNPIATPSGASQAGSVPGAGVASSSTANGTASTGPAFAGFNNSFAPASNAANGDVVVPSVPQRPPAVAANGAGTATGTEGADSGAPAIPSTPAETASAAAALTQTPQTGVAPAPSPNATAAAPPLTPGQPNAAGANAGAVPNGQASTTGATSIFGQAPQRPGTTASGSTGPGQIMSGGIAGVASKATGHTIKTINDQTNYSLWEFYYDPSKDTLRLGAAGQTGAQNTRTGAPGQAGTTNGFGFGTSTSVSGTPSASPTGTSTTPASSTPPPQNPPQ